MQEANHAIIMLIHYDRHRRSKSGCDLNMWVWPEYVGVYILFPPLPPNSISPDKTLTGKLFLEMTIAIFH